MSEYEKAIDLMGQEIKDIRTGLEKFIEFVNNAKTQTDINNAILFARTVLDYSGPKQPATETTVCPECKGLAEWHGQKCPGCNGSGKISVEETT